MSRWDWMKTVAAAVLTAVMMFFLGNRSAIYDWLEALVHIGLLAGGFYCGLPGGLAADGAAIGVGWYVLGWNRIQIMAVIIGGSCGIIFRRLGKTAYGLAYLSGIALIYAWGKSAYPAAAFEAMMIGMAVFLILHYPLRMDLGQGKGKKFGEKGSSAGTVPGETTAGGENAVTVAPCDLLYESQSGKIWRRLANGFQILADYFDDQELFCQNQENLSSEEWKNRFLESRQSIRVQFEQVGQIISRQQQRLDRQKDISGLYEKVLLSLFKRNHLIAGDIQVIENVDGQQEIYAQLACRKGSHMSVKALAAMIQPAVGQRFVPAYDSCSVISEREREIHLVERRKFKVLYGIARKNRDGEACSGDCFSTKHLGENRLLLCLSDGMGTGKQAEIESQMAVELLEQLLDTGFSLYAAVYMTNQVLLNSRSSQNPTTLDICVIDLYSGICQMAKLGAVPGYLKRGDGVSAIRGQNVPVGMLSWEPKGNQRQAIHTEQLQSGDRLILMTDGVLEKAGMASDEILKDLIAGCRIQNSREMADWLLEQILLLDPEVKDDMTILVAGIWAKN